MLTITIEPDRITVRGTVETEEDLHTIAPYFGNGPHDSPECDGTKYIFAHVVAGGVTHGGMVEIKVGTYITLDVPKAIVDKQENDAIMRLSRELERDVNTTSA